MSVIPPKSDRVWLDVLTGDEARFQSLATRLVVTRVRDSVRQDHCKLQSAIDELYQYFDSNGFATRDLQSL